MCNNVTTHLVPFFVALCMSGLVTPLVHFLRIEMRHILEENGYEYIGTVFEYMNTLVS